MNTLYIHDGCIDLIGFDELINKAYFSIRNGGLTISSRKMDITRQKEFIISNTRQISDENLSELLILYGFLNSHSFLKKDDVYYCEFIETPKIDRKELLQQYGLSSLLLELDNTYIKKA